MTISNGYIYFSLVIFPCEVETEIPIHQLKKQKGLTKFGETHSPVLPLRRTP